MKSIKHIRLPHYDYSSNGCYFVTITSHLRKPLFVNKRDIIEDALKAISSDEAVLDFHVIMPDHLHMIIMLQDSSLSLGEIIRRLKARASKEAGCRLWQPNYYEHVVRSEKALNKIREYIMTNPGETEIDMDAFYKRP